MERSALGRDSSGPLQARWSVGRLPLCLNVNVIMEGGWPAPLRAFPPSSIRPPQPVTFVLVSQSRDSAWPDATRWEAGIPEKVVNANDKRENKRKTVDDESEQKRKKNPEKRKGKNNRCYYCKLSSEMLVSLCVCVCTYLCV